MMPDNQIKPSQIATVIITQSVPEECSKGYQELQAKLTERVKSFEGFIGTEILPPKAGVQEAWVVIFRFNNPDSLQRWLESRERLEIVEKMDGLLPKKARIQILAQPVKDHVTVVFSHRIAPGKEKEYRAWKHRMLRTEESFEGFLGQESFEPVEGLTSEWVDMARFANKEAVDAWMKSPERKALVKELEPLVENIDVRRLGTGLDGWFRTQQNPGLGNAPPAWKQALSVWLALYPTVMLLTYYMNPLFQGLELPAMMLIGNMASVAILTWIVMPQVNRFLGFWLAPRKPSLFRDIGVAAGMMGALLIMWQIFRSLRPG